MAKNVAAMSKAMLTSPDESAAMRVPERGPSGLGAWVLAARPATLSAALVPVAVGTACGLAVGDLAASHIGGGGGWWAAGLALWSAAWIQIGTNFANDVFDFEQGADTSERLGPPRAAQLGLLSPRAIRIGMVISFGLATLGGIGLTFLAGWPIVAIGTLSIASGIAYTGGPYPLGYHGLGDVFVIVFFGFVAVCGAAWVFAGAIPPVAWLASLSVGALATAILVVNNVRDERSDRAAGKRTLVVRFGSRWGRAEYGALLALAYVSPALMWALNMTGPAPLLCWLTAPWAGWLVRRVASDNGRALNPSLVGTARLLLGFGVLLAVGIALG